MRSKHQVLDRPCKFLTENGVLHSDDLGLVLQRPLKLKQPANELSDCDPGLKSTEGGPQSGVPAVQSPEPALLGSCEEYLSGVLLGFGANEAGHFLAVLDLAHLLLCRLPCLFDHLEGSLPQRMALIQAEA